MPSKTDIIEALLFASDKPVPLKKLAQVVDIPVEGALAELDVLRDEKERIGALQLIEVAGGWQIVTKPAFSPFIRQLRDAPRQRLSRAAFEVLAIVAYRQPVTRSEVEALRGVDCSGPVQFLLEKKLINFAGRKDAPGRPHLYATTPEFLDHFGLRDIADLPSLEELVELNNGTLIHDGDRLFNRGEMRTIEEDETTAGGKETPAAPQEAANQNTEATSESTEVSGPEALITEAEDTTAVSPEVDRPDSPEAEADVNAAEPAEAEPADPGPAAAREYVFSEDPPRNETASPEAGEPQGIEAREQVEELPSDTRDSGASAEDVAVDADADDAEIVPGDASPISAEHEEPIDSQAVVA
jgi:segregation and condensation protein B